MVAKLKILSDDAHLFSADIGRNQVKINDCLEGFPFFIHKFRFAIRRRRGVVDVLPTVGHHVGRNIELRRPLSIFRRQRVEFEKRRTFVPIAADDNVISFLKLLQTDVFQIIHLLFFQRTVAVVRRIMDVYDDQILSFCRSKTLD